MFEFAETPFLLERNSLVWASKVSAVRELPRYAGVPLIFVTVLSDFETRAKSIAKGCVDLIAKPFIPSEVVLKALTAGWGARLDRYLNRFKGDRSSSAAAPEGPVAQQLAQLRGVLCMEPNGRIKTANDDCARIFGQPAAAMVGRHLLHFLPAPLQAEEHARHVTDVLAGRAKPMGGLLVAGLRQNSQPVPLVMSLSQTLFQGRPLLVALLRHAAVAQRFAKEKNSAVSPQSL